jgi:hypothetical protein
MNAVENRSDVVVKALEWAQKASEVRQEAITQLLAQQEQIQRDLKTLGYTPDQRLNGANGTTVEVVSVENVTKPRSAGKRFQGFTLAEVGRMLLEEHGSLHGKKIEEMAKAGGFKGGTKNFQNYLPVAFKRDGGFENIGGNTWKLKDSPVAK